MATVFNYDQWHKDRETSLRTNWLTLVGRFWLKEGENRFGSDQQLEVPLPAGKVPQQAGIFRLHADGKVTAKIASDVAGIICKGTPLSPGTELEMVNDMDGSPTVLEIGDVKFHIIKRVFGEKIRYAVRAKDMSSPALQAFKGLEFFAVSEQYRVKAKFIPHLDANTKLPRHKIISMPNVLGEPTDMECPGFVEFVVNGVKCTLEPVFDDDDKEKKKLFFIFKDQTCGKTTYPPGRFLFTDPADSDGSVWLDFNKAYSPPCGYTDYATCPLPPKQNQLTHVAIEAGEKYSGFGHH